VVSEVGPWEVVATEDRSMFPTFVTKFSFLVYLWAKLLTFFL